MTKNEENQKNNKIGKLEPISEELWLWELEEQEIKSTARFLGGKDMLVCDPRFSQKSDYMQEFLDEHKGKEQEMLEMLYG